jgi:hypothetical protein
MSCNSAEQNNATDSNKFYAISKSNIPDYSLIPVTEVSIIKKNLNQYDVYDFDLRNHSQKFDCVKSADHHETRIAYGDLQLNNQLPVIF